MCDTQYQLESPEPSWQYRPGYDTLSRRVYNDQQGQLRNQPSRIIAVTTTLLHHHHNHGFYFAAPLRFFVHSARLPLLPLMHNK